MNVLTLHNPGYVTQDTQVSGYSCQNQRSRIQSARIARIPEVSEYNVVQFENVFMRSILLLFVSLCSLALPAQDTIKVETTDAMPVCKPALPQATPCATAALAISKENPKYSEKARRSHREGAVVLNLIVDEEGEPRDIRVVKSVGDGLDEEAVEAVKHWKFQPGTYQGKAVSVQIAVEVNFRLTTTPSSSPSQSAASSDGQRQQLNNLYSDANSAYQRRDFQTAANLSRRMTSMFPLNANAWSVLGSSLLELHELNQAATALETAVKLDPASSFALINLGRVYWRQRRYDEAQAQFAKQIALNPDDHYAHGNLGMMLRDQKKCSVALAELEKALTLTPNNFAVMLALGECNLDLGNKSKGLSYLEQAASEASTPGTWNGAAYQLALRNIELDRAQRWAQTAIDGESTQLRDISLDHLSTAQLGRAADIASYWDTMGWVLYQRGSYEQSVQYLQAAFSVRVLPVIAYHLGRVDEALSQPDDATRAYALAIAAADSPLVQPLNPDEADAVADARKRLAKVLPDEKAVTKLVDAERASLSAMRTVSIENLAKAGGAADFTINVASSGKAVGVRQVSGDASFAAFSAPLQSATLPSQFPLATDIEIPRRGTLTCEAGKPQCSFVLLSADDAVDLSRKESATDATALAQSTAPDPHTYNNASLGMKISLPDEWQLVHEEPGTFSRPHSATLGKPGTVAFFVLMREHLEGSSDLYSKMLEAGFSQREEYRRIGDREVKRDGIAGTRWSVGWKEKGIPYSGLLEFFSVGEDRYQLMALAPSEVYARYSDDFENMLQSLRFPILHTDPKVFEKP